MLGVPGTAVSRGTGTGASCKGRRGTAWPGKSHRDGSSHESRLCCDVGCLSWGEIPAAYMPLTQRKVRVTRSNDIKYESIMHIKRYRALYTSHMLQSLK